jgi:hypothetical protein
MEPHDEQLIQLLAQTEAGMNSSRDKNKLNKRPSKQRTGYALVNHCRTWIHPDRRNPQPVQTGVDNSGFIFLDGDFKAALR